MTLIERGINFGAIKGLVSFIIIFFYFIAFLLFIYCSKLLMFETIGQVFEDLDKSSFNRDRHE